MDCFTFHDFVWVCVCKNMHRRTITTVNSHTPVSQREEKEDVLHHRALRYSRGWDGGVMHDLQPSGSELGEDCTQQYQTLNSALWWSTPAGCFSSKQEHLFLDWVRSETGLLCKKVVFRFELIGVDCCWDLCLFNCVRIWALFGFYDVNIYF